MDSTALASLGLNLPSPAYLIGMVLFSLVGIAAFRSSRKTGRWQTTAYGLALMLFPYAVSSTGWLWAVGCALCVALWFDRRR